MILSIAAWFNKYFWHERLWFPEGLGWADVQDRDNHVYAKSGDLWVTIPMALFILIVRQVFERMVATPLASVMGIREQVRLRAAPNPTLESYFCTMSKHPTQTVMQTLGKQTGLSIQQVQRWFLRRRNQDRPSMLKKFREASWRFTFYLLAFAVALACHVDKPWLYDLNQMWKGFPTLALLPFQYWYYMIELSFYIALVFSLASDVKRKDFKEQIVHHIATILLLSLSWCVNYVRVGAVIMLLHDVSDCFLESAKMFNYAGWKKTCNFLFVMFAVIFFITRLIIFPFRIIYCTLIYGLFVYRPFFGFYFFSSLLLVLQFLHIFWGVLIIRMAVKLAGNEPVEDERSDKEETDKSEEEEEQEEVEKLDNGPVKNGFPALNKNHCKTE